MSGYQDAMAEIETASRDQRQRMAAMQAHSDHMGRLFKDAIENAQPSSEDLRNLLLANLTTKPPSHLGSLALTWMQRSPGDWPGWYPEYCQRVAELAGIGEEVT